MFYETNLTFLESPSYYVFFPRNLVEKYISKGSLIKMRFLSALSVGALRRFVLLLEA